MLEQGNDSVIPGFNWPAFLKVVRTLKRDIARLREQVGDFPPDESTDQTLSRLLDVNAKLDMVLRERQGLSE